MGLVKSYRLLIHNAGIRARAGVIGGKDGNIDATRAAVLLGTKQDEDVCEQRKQKQNHDRKRYR